MNKELINKNSKKIIDKLLMDNGKLLKSFFLTIGLLVSSNQAFASQNQEVNQNLILDKLEKKVVIYDKKGHLSEPKNAYDILSNNYNQKDLNEIQKIKDIQPKIISIMGKNGDSIIINNHSIRLNHDSNKYEVENIKTNSIQEFNNLSEATDTFLNESGAKEQSEKFYKTIQSKLVLNEDGSLSLKEKNNSPKIEKNGIEIE